MIYGRAGLTLLLSLTLCSCASRSDYGKFAEAGTAYAQASNALLESSANLKLDARSEAMLFERDSTLLALKARQKAAEERGDLSPAQKKEEKEKLEAAWKKDLLRDYGLSRNAEIAYLALISKLKLHNALLADYFSKLSALASDKAGADLEKSIAESGKALEKLGKELEISANGYGAAIAAAGKITVDLALRASLKKELELRGASIERQLQIQKALLIYLSRSMKEDAKAVAAALETRRVTDPFVDTREIGNVDKWKENRLAAVRFEFLSEELKRAEETSEKMRQAYEDLASNRLDTARLETLMADAQNILNAAKEIQKLSQ